MSRHEQKIKDGVARFLQDGEHVLAAVIAAPRGSTRQATGWMQLGSPQRGRAHGAAEQVDLRHRIGGQVRKLLSAVPIGDVDAIVVPRLAMRYKITVTVRGIPIRLEANAASGAMAFAKALTGTTVVGV
jgi:hypothetical protein